MRLADFILQNREPILREWEAFARTCSPASGSMNVEALRDHADQMLTAFAADLRTPQGSREQAEKSRGEAVEADSTDQTAAEEHGAGRAQSGFTIEQMVAEYRALRASVLRLWTEAEEGLAADDLIDLTRFNEALDQALAESVSQYNEDLERSKEIFIAILGHDLRTPLAAITTSSSFVLDLGGLSEKQQSLITRIRGSAVGAIGMVGDLLDFTRGRLGGGIPVAPSHVGLVSVIEQVIGEITAAKPGAHIELHAHGDECGEWDSARLGQALTNLIGNAVEHGRAGASVEVSLIGEEGRVLMLIHNEGLAIPADNLNGIFNPMKPRDPRHAPRTSVPTGSLGLGLYIAERIIAAHGGHIEVSSSDASGTTFTVCLPRGVDARRAG